MGKLVTFIAKGRPAGAGQKAGKGENPAGDAEILMFTGVRYERSGPPAPTKRSDPNKPRRRRG